MANHGKRYTWRGVPATSHPTAGAAEVASRRRAAVTEHDDNDDGFDLEWRKCTVEELFVTLGTWPWGLTSAVAAARLRIWGGNELEPKKQMSWVSKLLPVAVEAAAAVAMSIGLARGRGRGVFGAVVVLVAADLAFGLAESYSAGTAAANALVARLAPSRQACWLARDGVWSEQDAAAAVPGDVIWIRSGDVVPADARFLETQSTPVKIKIDESALTGDPVPAVKRHGDVVYAGSACVKGEAAAVVVAGGAHTYLAGAVRLADATNNVPFCRAIVGVLNVIWNALVVTTCFLTLVDVVVDDVRYSAGDIGCLLVTSVLYFGSMGFMLAVDWESMSAAEQRRRPRRPERDPEQLMRRLGTLREQGKISEETVQRCREMFGEEPVCDELVAELASHFGWVTPAVAEHCENRDGRPCAD